MARRTLIRLQDDLSGELLAEGHGETVGFGLDGRWYEIDLSAENAEQLRAVLRRYIDAGRRMTAPRPARTAGRAGRSRGGRGENAAIRQWARAHGRPVAGRGRIPASVMKAYRAEH
jgi:Lsr2